jgi:hypothetical protein
MLRQAVEGKLWVSEKRCGVCARFQFKLGHTEVNGDNQQNTSNSMKHFVNVKRRITYRRSQ